MLTASQCETVAYIGEGEIICPDCARKTESSLTLEKLEQGYPTGSDLRPLSRYEIDESSGSQQYERAEEKLDDWCLDHPRLAALLGVDETERLVVTLRGKACAPFGTLVRRRVIRDAMPNRYRAIDNLAEREIGETCGDCGNEL